MYKKILFWFRQDLRIEDNTWLWKAVQDGELVCPVFIFDITVLNQFPKPDKRLSFVYAAVQDLGRQLAEIGLNLEVYIGNPLQIIPELVEKHACDAIYANKSYGVWSLGRDSALNQRAREHSVYMQLRDDYLLIEPDQIPARKVFTPFFNLRKKIQKTSLLPWLPKVATSSSLTYESVYTELIQQGYLCTDNSYLEIRPLDWRKTRMHDFLLENYDETRNFPAIDGSTKLSPYLRFWLVSIRTVYWHAAQSDTPGAQIFISELAWRDFWQHIAYHFPEARYKEFQQKRRDMQWRNNESWMEAWKTWKTGYPIVDAGMRQLIKEWWMHNRVRMIVASFLTKDLLIDWRRWERYFAEYLLDYDANVNIGNRQRSASVGADPKPLRIFNPILQSQRFDPNAAYILRYCPELEGQQIKAIHDPLTYNLDYIPPIVNHYETSKEAKHMYYKLASEHTA